MSTGKSKTEYSYSYDQCASERNVLSVNVVYKIVGIAIIVAGVIITIHPDLVGSRVNATSVFDAVEQRARWGGLIAIGVMFLLFIRIRPWALTIATLGLGTSIGYLIARSIGIAIEGADIQQWVWLAAEVIIAVAMTVWYRQLRNPEVAGG